MINFKLILVFLFIVSLAFSNTTYSHGCSGNLFCRNHKKHKQPEESDSTKIVSLEFNRLILNQSDSEGMKNGWWMDSSDQSFVVFYQFVHGYLNGKIITLFRKDKSKIIPGSFSVEEYHQDVYTARREYQDYMLLYSISSIHNNTVSFNYTPENSGTAITVTPPLYGRLIAWYPDPAAIGKPVAKETGSVMFFNIHYSFKSYPFYRDSAHNYYSRQGDLIMTREYHANQIIKETKFNNADSK